MTITTPEIIKTMLENNGRYPGDPQAYSVHDYTCTHNNQVVWHVSMCPLGEWELIHSPFCTKVNLLWRQDSGLTFRGRQFLGLKVNE